MSGAHITVYYINICILSVFDDLIFVANCLPGNTFCRNLTKRNFSTGNCYEFRAMTEVGASNE